MGCFKRGPITGKERKNRTMVPKKSPKRYKIPTASTLKPMNEYFNNMRQIPEKKNKVALIFVGRAKKYMVRDGPMMSTTPIMKRMLPMARRLASKKVMTPKKKNTTPAAVEATPYSEVSFVRV